MIAFDYRKSVIQLNRKKKPLIIVDQPLYKYVSLVWNKSTDSAADTKRVEYQFFAAPRYLYVCTNVSSQSASAYLRAHGVDLQRASGGHFQPISHTLLGCGRRALYHCDIFI